MLAGHKKDLAVIREMDLPVTSVFHVGNVRDIGQIDIVGVSRVIGDGDERL
jgi:hypothetical protein